MKTIKYCALVAAIALVGVACQSAPEEAANAPANEAVAANSVANGETVAANAVANGATEVAATDAHAEPQRRERPQPEAPRAEGDMLAEILASGDYLLLDVRRPEELEELGTVEGYLNIPVGELADRLDEVPRDKPILTA